MDKSSKPKADGMLEKEHGKGKGLDQGRTKDVSKEMDKERRTEGSDGGNRDCGPIVRKSALMRTPPTSSTPSRLDLTDSPAGKPPPEKAARLGAAKDSKDIRTERPDPFRKSGINRSPTKKLCRTGSFSEIEKKISYGKASEIPANNDVRKRKRSNTDETDESRNCKEKKSAIQLIKLKLAELKDEVCNEVLKTAKMENLVDELSTLVTMAEAEEMINLEEGKDGGFLRKRRTINGKITKIQNYEQFLEVDEMDWPEECYSRTTINSGNFPTDKGDIIFLKNSDDPEMNLGVAKRLKENFPEIAQINEESWETLITHSRRASQKGQGTEWEKRIHVGKDARGENLFKALVELKNLMVETNREKGVLPLDKGRVDSESLVKMLECIFRDTSIKIEIYSNDLERGPVMKERNFKNNAVLIKTNKQNYADTLRKVKSRIEKSGKAMEFRKIRSTRDGNMLIELKEGDQGKELEKAITGDGGEMETRILQKGRSGTQKYIIRDLDALITGDEIGEILKENAADEDEKESVRVISIRKAEGETQTAIIELSSNQGDRIDRDGGIALGLIKSTLKKWVEVTRCFRCWEPGHRASDCKGIDRTSACLRCGKTDGHNAKSCSNVDFCPLCHREGHRAGSGACPKMRLAIASLQKQQANRRRLSRK